MAVITGNMLFDLLGVIVATFAVIFAYFQWNYQMWKRKNIPHFPASFPYGNRKPLYKQVSLGDDVYSIVQDAKEKGWNYFGMFIGMKSFFVPLDLEMIKCVLTKDFNHFTDRGFFYNEKDDPLSAHLFAIGGTKWRKLRTKLTPTFTSGKMKGMFQTLVNCSSLLEQALKEHNSNEPVDIKNALVCFTTDVIGSCAFGIECNSFKETDSPFMKYGRKVFTRSYIQRMVDIFTISFPNLALALHMKTVPKDVSQFFYNVVEKTVSYREKNNFSRKDFLQLLIDIKNDQGEQSIENKGEGTTLTMDEIVAQCFVFFLAGFETSSTTVTFALFELSLNLEIQDKVREELMRVLKKYDNKMSYDALKELVYMQQVLDETLRKYPPLPFVSRKCVLDYKIPDTNVILEKGTHVIIPIKNIHYDENIYEQPEKFDPERFTAEQIQNRHQYAHIPFGEGPRICIGMRFGLMQSKVALATILSKFRVKLSSKTKTPLEMDPKSFITSTKGGVWLDLEKIYQ